MRAVPCSIRPARTKAASVNVTSPSAGRVLRVPQESEAVIAAGTPIVEVGDPQHVEVIAEFLSQDAVRMKHGAPAQIENWGGPPLPAVVDRVEPVARTKISALGVEEQRTNVILQFTGRSRRDQLQAHDFRVDVRVVVREAKNAVRVPLGALFRRGDGWALYKVVDGRAKLTEVAGRGGRCALSRGHRRGQRRRRSHRLSEQLDCRRRAHRAAEIVGRQAQRRPPVAQLRHARLSAQRSGLAVSTTVPPCRS